VNEETMSLQGWLESLPRAAKVYDGQHEWSPGMLEASLGETALDTDGDAGALPDGRATWTMRGDATPSFVEVRS
jgi:hypothetical protein